MRRMAGMVAALVALAPATAWAEEAPAVESPADDGRWGVALNTSVNGEVTAMRFVPSVTWRKGKGQLEAGVGVHPWIRRDQRVLSGELNAKAFPNGADNKLNLYVLSRFSYVNNKRETYYPTTYHYLFLNGGYGLMLRGAGGIEMGTNVTAGAYTFARSSENPYPGWEEDGLFAEVGFNVAYQFDLGWRF